MHDTKTFARPASHNSNCDEKIAQNRQEDYKKKKKTDGNHTAATCSQKALRHQEKEQRLEAALRANLRRRKARNTDDT